jgi:hypothetical protein
MIGQISADDDTIMGQGKILENCGSLCRKFQLQTKCSRRTEIPDVRQSLIENGKQNKAGSVRGHCELSQDWELPNGGAQISSPM